MKLSPALAPYFEAVAVADLLVVMDTGHIEQADSAHEIFTSPSSGP